MMAKKKPSTLLIVLLAICIPTIIFCYIHIVHSGGQNLVKDHQAEVKQEATYSNFSEIISADDKYGRKYFVWTGESWPSKHVKTSVCLATQGSPNYLHWVEIQARYWKGPISVGVYAPGLDFMVAYNRIRYLRGCYKAVREFVSFHIVFSVEHPPLFAEELIKDIECTSTEVAKVFKTVLYANLSSDSLFKYPQNHVRNTARNACPTSYTMSVDIDMIPYEGMSAKMDTFFSGIEFENCAYVVPVYEIHSDVEKFPPSNKQELLSLVKEKKARIFHSAVFQPNQLNSDLAKWEKNNTTNTKVDISHRVQKYAEYWEPILVLHSSAPDFFERFIGYGFTRNTHVYFLNILHYHFIVLENAFLSHSGFQVRSVIYNPTRQNELTNNSNLYKSFKREMSRKYEK